MCQLPRDGVAQTRPGYIKSTYDKVYLDRPVARPAHGRDCTAELTDAFPEIISTDA